MRTAAAIQVGARCISDSLWDHLSCEAPFYSVELAEESLAHEILAIKLFFVLTEKVLQKPFDVLRILICCKGAQVEAQ
jgi:hypothetical protein